MKKILIIVDIQNDFCPNGNLAVKDGDLIIPYVNKLIRSKDYDFIVATKDWHPKDHKSFASNNNKAVGEFIKLNGVLQILWPDHCIKGTVGSQLHSELDQDNIDFIFTKGSNKEIDSYSSFFENDYKTKTGLDEFLKAKSVTDIDVVGLALDYCVKATAIDAQSLGYNTTVFLEGTKAVNIKEGDDKQAIELLRSKKVKVI
jgi:nicotinamidase/pyrazinamidase